VGFWNIRTFSSLDVVDAELTVIGTPADFVLS
jgi:hypothetical protein